MRWRSMSTAVVLTVVGVPSAAAATYTYASSSAPQYVSGYGSTARTYGKWDITKPSSTAVRSKLVSTYYRYTDGDNHTVYAVLYTDVSGGFPATNGSTSSSHDNVVSSSWTSFRSLPNHTVSATTAIRSATGNIRSCLDVPFRTDPCSSFKSPSVSY